jgi:uncharacterized protein (DUF1684 family)
VQIVLSDTEINQHFEEISLWQQNMEKSLRAENGWLALVGLEWLHEGINTIGSAAGSDVQLPETAPAKLGFIEFSGEEAKLTVETDEIVTIDDTPIKSAILLADATGTPSRVKVGSITFFVIKRGTQYGIRISDSKSAAMADFTGRKWFPIDSRYRVPATFMPHPTARSIQILNSVGMIVPMENPGYVEFELDGQQLKLEAFEAGEKQWWFIFKDGTSGSSTYGSGRFMYVQRPEDGQVWIDFNRAYNPPCVFTPYATCPLAPKENTLPIQIHAGEQY